MWHVCPPRQCIPAQYASAVDATRRCCLPLFSNHKLLLPLLPAARCRPPFIPTPLAAARTTGPGASSSLPNDGAFFWLAARRTQRTAIVQAVPPSPTSYRHNGVNSRLSHLDAVLFCSDTITFVLPWLPTGYELSKQVESLGTSGLF